MWDAVCVEQDLKPRRMPRDVSTQWNSAFDMTDFAVSYHQVLKAMTDKQKLGLAGLAIDDSEWELLTQLHDVLKVCAYFMY